VLRARAYLDASAGSVFLVALAGSVRLSKSHLPRPFHKGVSIAEAAQVAGFADQSHLTDDFKGRLGFTPGEYVRTLIRTEARRDPKTA